MYRLIIVEDEDIEREGLRDLVDWKSMGIEMAGAFDGSRDALKFVQNNAADILLTDIKLIGMDGLELSRRIRETLPDIKVVITSAYQEFEYARSAIELNAYGYISKPVKMNELRAIFEKVLGICRTEDRERSEQERLKQIIDRSLPLLMDRFLHNLVLDQMDWPEIKEKLEYFNIRMGDNLFAVVSDLDHFEELKDGRSRDEMHILTFKILEVLKEVQCTGSEMDTLTFQIDAGRYCTIVNHSFTDLPDLHEATIQYAMQLQSAVNARCGVHITIGIGKPVASPRSLRLSYKSACDTLQYRFFMGSNQILNFTDVSDGCSNENRVDVEPVIGRILSSMDICDETGFRENIEKYFELLEENKMDAPSIRNACLNLIARISLLLAGKNESFEKVFGKELLVWEKLLKFDTIYDIRIWLKNILEAIFEVLLKKKEGNSKKIIEEILAVVEQKFNGNLNIMDISREVYLSPNYISILFRREMGENFSDYLKRFRLEKARQFLQNPQFKVYQVGNMVGYTSIPHFCSIFKDFYGVSPSEYRERM